MAKIDNISDEMLAAYLEGNTSADETMQVLNALQADDVLSETLSVALDIDAEDDSSVVLPMMQMAAEGNGNLCGLRCEEYIFSRRGMVFDENMLIKTACENDWLKPEGIPLHSIGQLLADKGLMVVRKYDATVGDIVEALALDNDIIVAVDSDKLYPERTDEDDAPNHAVVVTSIDSTSNTIGLYDPQSDSVHDFPISRFEYAWNESCNYMVRILRSLEEYVPQPINLNHVSITDDLLELREAIAENAHDVWAATRIKEGWKYGPVRDDEKKQHPDLIPYSSLPDSEKEYDRLMAMNTIKLVRKLGFEIVKH